MGYLSLSYNLFDQSIPTKQERKKHQIEKKRERGTHTHCHNPFYPTAFELMKSQTTQMISQNQPSKELCSRMNLPQDAVCTHEFDCALSQSILIQGNLYIFNTAISFHSLSSRYSTTEALDTLLVIPYRQIISLKKRRLLLFKDSIQIDTANESYFLTSFFDRDQVYNIIQDSKAAWLNIELRYPYFPEFSMFKVQKQPYYLQNEDQIWLSNAIRSIENFPNQEQQMNSKSIEQTNNVSMQNQNDQHMEQQLKLQNNLYVSSATMNEFDLFNRAHIRNISSISSETVRILQTNEIISQVLLPQNICDQQCNNGLKILESNEVSTKNQSNQQQTPSVSPKQCQEKIHPEINQAQEGLKSAENGCLANIEENQDLTHEHENSINNQIDQTLMSPLEMQKSCLKDLDSYSAQFKDQFDERERLSLKTVSNDFNTTDTIEIILPLMSAREVFCLFFSNQIFQRREKTYNSFGEYYVLEHLHGEGLTVSEIAPPSPEIFQSVYSNNFAQLLDFQLTSDRIFSFTHPTQNTSMFLPKSLNCSMQEKIFWSSPQSFLLTRVIHLKGVPGVGSFEPMIVFMISERDKDVVLKYGFKIHFKGSTMFKAKIEEAAMEECKKNWNEIKNLIVNISQEHKEKRDANKWMNSKINPKFEIPCDLTSFEIPDYEEEGEQEEDYESQECLNQKIPSFEGKYINKEQRKQQKQQNGAANIQQTQLSQDQRILYGQDLGNVAAKASKEACVIF